MSSATTTTASACESATEDTLTTCVCTESSVTTPSFNFGPATKDTPFTLLTPFTPSFNFGFTAKDTPVTTTRSSPFLFEAKSLGKSEVKSPPENCAGTVTSRGTSSEQSSEQKESPSSCEDLEVAGTLLILPRMNLDVSKPWETPSQTFRWTLRDQLKRKGVYGMASEMFFCEGVSWRLFLYSIGFPTKVADKEHYTVGPLAAIALRPVKGTIMRGSGAFHWILDVKTTDDKLLKRFHSRRYQSGDTVREEYFLLPPKLAERIHRFSLFTLHYLISVVCKLTLEKEEEFNPGSGSERRIFENEASPSEEQEESLRGYHYLEEARISEFHKKFTWIIRDWPTKKGVVSEPTFHFILCFQSIDFSEDEAFEKEPQEPRWVLIGIVPRHQWSDSSGKYVFHWKLDVKLTDGGTLLKSFSRRAPIEEGKLLPIEYFVLPRELAHGIQSGNRFSVVCQLECILEEDHDSLSAEAATQTELTSVDVRCYCNLPVCATTGRMCRSSAGICASEKSTEAHPWRHACLELLLEDPRRTGRSCEDNVTRRRCCSEDMCNYFGGLAETSPRGSNRSHVTGYLSNHDTSLLLLRNGEGSATPPRHRPLFFRFAIIAVPLAGCFVLALLVVMATRMLRAERRRQTRLKPADSARTLVVFRRNRNSLPKSLSCVLPGASGVHAGHVVRSCASATSLWGTSPQLQLQLNRSASLALSTDSGCTDTSREKYFVFDV